MAKAKSIFFIIAAVGIIYALLTAFMPVVSDIVGDTDAELDARSINVTANYVGAKEGLDYMPWLLYLVPGVIAVVAVVIVLRREEGP